MNIALVGKYVKLHDAYLSVAEALRHAGYENGAAVNIHWVDSEQITAETAADSSRRLRRHHPARRLRRPGHRGDDYAPPSTPGTNNIPYFGICLGMQIAVIEYARHVLGFADANSGEFVRRQHPSGHRPDARPAGESSQRAAPCGWERIPALQKRALCCHRSYGQAQLSERHRHRYEFNNRFRPQFEQAGMRVAGTSPDGRLVEAVELPDHDYYLGVQYHPEFKSRPNRAHPLFKQFIAAALKRSQQL